MRAGNPTRAVAIGELPAICSRSHPVGPLPADATATVAGSKAVSSLVVAVLA
ncbi:unnamed protein product [Musa textilis]